MKSLHLPHHSPEDWDYGSDRWEFDHGVFVSPPSSFHATGPLWSILCRHPATQNLLAGQVQVWLRGAFSSGNGVHFMNQSPLGSASEDNTHLVYGWKNQNIRASKRVDWVHTDFGEWPCSLPPDTWTQIRVSWWVSTSPQCARSVKIRLETWDGVYWWDHGDLEDPNPTFLDSGINRVGLHPRIEDAWCDDVVIYGPA